MVVSTSPVSNLPLILHSQAPSNFILSNQKSFLTGKFLGMKTHVILNE